MQGSILAVQGNMEKVVDPIQFTYDGGVDCCMFQKVFTVFEKDVLPFSLLIL